MSRTQRDIDQARERKFHEEYYGSAKTVQVRLWNVFHSQFEKEAAARKLRPMYRWGLGFGTFQRRDNNRKYRHHIKQICRTQQFERLHRRDHILKEYLD